MVDRGWKDMRQSIGNPRVCHWLCQCEVQFNIRQTHWQSQWHTN